MPMIELSEETIEMLKEIAKIASKTHKLSDGAPVFKTPRDAINYLIGTNMARNEEINKLVTNKH